MVTERMITIGCQLLTRLLTGQNRGRVSKSAAILPKVAEDDFNFSVYKDRHLFVSLTHFLFVCLLPGSFICTYSSVLSHPLKRRQLVDTFHTQLNLC